MRTRYFTLCIVAVGSFIKNNHKKSGMDCWPNHSLYLCFKTLSEDHTTGFRRERRETEAGREKERERERGRGKYDNHLCSVARKPYKSFLSTRFNVADNGHVLRDFVREINFKNITFKVLKIKKAVLHIYRMIIRQMYDWLTLINYVLSIVVLT